MVGYSGAGDAKVKSRIVAKARCAIGGIGSQSELSDMSVPNRM